MAGEESKKLSGEVASLSFSTVESLRGRLLAERQVSRLANEEAELLENKLKELEEKLREESKLREKAEKKLNFLMKKLQSLTLDPPRDLCVSSSSESSGLFSSNASSSCVTASTSSSAKDAEEAESMFQNRNPDDQSSSRWRNELDGRRSDGCVDHNSNSVALVPAVSMAASASKSGSPSRELKMTNNNKGVVEVLEALRRAREKIEESMAARNEAVMYPYSNAVGPV